ncbi:MAG: type VI secretion system baseplate subunit TssK [Candidatus Desantisbacteria bacterium]
MSILPKVNWSEGMFLRPHHLQTASRYFSSSLSMEINQIQSYAWGIISLQISEAELENFSFAIKSARLKMRDGSFVSVPDNTDVEPREMKEFLNKADGSLDVFFALPRLRDKSLNTLPLDKKIESGYDPRYITHLYKVTDENTGENPQEIETKKLNGKIFFSGENVTGYETIKIARVIRSGDSRNIPVLSTEFFPPALELKAFSPLDKLCQDVYHRLAAKNRMLIAQVTGGNISFSGNIADAIQIMLKIQTTSSFAAIIRQLIETPHLHPYIIYLEFCRLAGELSIFGKNMEFSDIPFYDQDQLGVCFKGLCEQINQLLEQVISTVYNKVEFKEKNNRLECELKEEWATTGMEFYLGVESDYEEDIVFNKLERVKLGAVRDIPSFTAQRLPGLEKQRLRRIPPGLPDSNNTYYWRISQEGELWNNVLKDKIIAISGTIDPLMNIRLYILNTSKGGA